MSEKFTPLDPYLLQASNHLRKKLLELDPDNKHNLQHLFRNALCELYHIGVENTYQQNVQATLIFPSLGEIYHADTLTPIWGYLK